MLNIIFVFIIAAILILLIIAALQPADFQISRSEQIPPQSRPYLPMSITYNIGMPGLSGQNSTPLLNIRSKAPKPELVQLCDGLVTARSVQAQ